MNQHDTVKTRSNKDDGIEVCQTRDKLQKKFKSNRTEFTEITHIVTDMMAEGIDLGELEGRDQWAGCTQQVQFDVGW